MSNDVRIRSSRWSFPDSPEANAALLAHRAHQPHDQPSTGPISTVEMLTEMNLDVTLADGVITIEGAHDGGAWCGSDTIHPILEALAPLSTPGSYLEIESEYDSDPSRWVLHDGKVIEITPELLWLVPGESHGWGLDADSVRAELDEAAEMYGISVDNAEAIKALPNATINAAIDRCLDDEHWGVYDSLRSDAISLLASEVTS